MYTSKHQDSALQTHICQDKKPRRAYNKLLDKHAALEQAFADPEKRYELLQAELEPRFSRDGGSADGG